MFELDALVASRMADAQDLVLAEVGRRVFTIAPHPSWEGLEERLEERLADLRRELAKEVRRERLVVATPDGYVGVVAEVDADGADVTLQCPRGADDQADYTGIKLAADRKDGIESSGL